MKRHPAKGGTLGYLFRRACHVVAHIVIPMGYFQFIANSPGLWGLGVKHCLVAAIALVLVIEYIRTRLGFVFIGQRSHEAHGVSSAAFSLIGLLLLFLLVPVQGLVYAIAWSAGVLDPLLGELKFICSKTMTYVAALMLGWGIWFFCAVFFPFPLGYAFFMVPLILLLEYPSFKWLDDNFLMLAVPAIVVALILAIG